MAFSKQLDQVKNQFRDLSTALEEVCENLKGSDSPPPSEIMEEIINSANKISEELKFCVIEWAKSVQMPDIPDAQELDSIKAIMTFSKNIVAHQNNVQQDENVLRYINRALSIKYVKEDESFEGLEQFRRDLNNLKNRVSTSPTTEEVQKDKSQILEDKHWINDLFTLLECGEELDDERYGQISDIISEKYGRTFEAAAVRGRLILPNEEEPAPSPDAKEKPEDSKLESADDLSVDRQAEVQQEETSEDSPTITTQEESEESEPESVDDLPIGGQAPIEAELPHEKTESEDLPDKDGITEPKQEIDPDLSDKDIPAKLGFCFNASETAQSIASFLLKPADGKPERGFPDLFWALIQENRLSLAYWLARYAENKELDLSFTPPSYLIEALIHGLALQNETDSSAHCLYDIYNIYNEKFESLESEEAGYDAGIRLLVMAGALRPSLFAPHTGAHTVLKSHVPLSGLDAFFAICQAVEKFAEQGLPIITDSLTDAKDDQQWQEELDSLIEDATEWLERAPKMRMKYRPLERIWQRFVTDGKWVHNFVSPVVKNDESKIKDVLAMIQQCGSKRRIKDQVENQVDRIVNRKLKCGLDPLERGVQEAINFASRWVKLYKRRPRQSQDYRTGLIKMLRDDIQRHIDIAKDELNTFAERHENFKPILAGVAISRHVLDAITEIFNGEPSLPESNERFLLSTELLKIPNLELTEEWMPTEEALDNLGDYLVQYIALPESDRTWEKAFENQIQHRNHWATGNILDLMATKEEDTTVSQLEETRQDEIGKCITALENDIKITKNKIENSVWNGILTDQERLEFVRQVEEINPEEVLNFIPESHRLNKIRNQIEKINKNHIDGCKQRLGKLSISNDDQNRIDAVLKRGDVGTAEEFIAILEKGERLPNLSEDNRIDQFQDFFPKSIREFEELFKEKQPQRIISRIKNGNYVVE